MKFYRYIVTDQNREIKENSLLLIMIYQTFKKSSEKKNKCKKMKEKYGKL